MSQRLLVGDGREIREIADDEFVKGITKELPQHMAKRLEFMSRDHHAVRDFVVREIARRGHALSAGEIARGTGIDSRRVPGIVAQLEEHLLFLVRNADGNVSWAFPVTAERTAHHLQFSTGEEISGA
jgi:hypothetical protein